MTIIDSKINNLDINIENMNCEDSINLIRSEGTIKFLKVNNSKSDVVDFDFSNIAIEKAKINRSGNDCFDFSGRSICSN